MIWFLNSSNIVNILSLIKPIAESNIPSLKTNYKHGGLRTFENMGASLSLSPLQLNVHFNLNSTFGETNMPFAACMMNIFLIIFIKYKHMY